MNDPRITFFPKRKIRLELTDWKPKMNTEGEKRLRLDFTLPLIDDARDGVIPGWLRDPLNSMEENDSAQKDAGLDVTLEGVTMELWDTPKSPARQNLLTAVTLDGFALKRISRDKQTFIALVFNTNVKRDWNLLRWADKYESCYVWAEFTPTDPGVPSKPVEGAQMTIADASNEGEKDVVDHSQENIQAFFGKKGDAAETAITLNSCFTHGDHDGDECPKCADTTPTTDDLTAEAQAEVSGTPVEVMAKELGETKSEKLRRPKGFNKPTNTSAIN